MSVFEKLKHGSEKLQGVFGLNATLVRTIPGTKNRATGKVSNSTQTTRSIKVARTSVEIESKEGLRSKASAFILWEECLIGDVIIFANQSHKVIEVRETNPDGNGLIWTAIVGSGA